MTVSWLLNSVKYYIYNLHYLFNAINQIAKSLNLNPPATFRLDHETRATAGTRWPSWCSELCVFLAASSVTDADQKRAVLLLLMDQQQEQYTRHYTKRQRISTQTSSRSYPTILHRWRIRTMRFFASHKCNKYTVSLSTSSLFV